MAGIRSANGRGGDDVETSTLVRQREADLGCLSPAESPAEISTAKSVEARYMLQP